uniref:Homeobox domain-containing protein n=1 Tax=Strigamia maritima TaxID=126957 RepID=T1JIU8_STRMM
MSCWHVARTSSTGHHAGKVQNPSSSTYTDFSVDSILSTEKKTPCAQDQMPKSTKNEEIMSNSKLQVPFTSLQLAILETHYKTNAYISGIDVTYLSVYLNLSPNKIKVWFQNRRARERRLNKKNSDNKIPPDPLSPPYFIRNNNSSLASF